MVSLIGVLTPIMPIIDDGVFCALAGNAPGTAGCRTAGAARAFAGKKVSANVTGAKALTFNPGSATAATTKSTETANLTHILTISSYA